MGLKTRFIHITSEVSEGNSNGGHIKVSELNVHVIIHGPAKKSSKESTAIEGVVFKINLLIEMKSH